MSIPATSKTPIVQTVIIGIGLYVLVNALYFSREFVVPLIFATIFAILLEALVQFLTRMGLNRTVSIFIVLILALAFTLAVVCLIAYQTSSFVDDLPKLMKRLEMAANDTMKWLADKTGMDNGKMNEWFEKAKSDKMKQGPAMVSKTLSGLNNALALLFIMPVYIFMILYYKTHLLEFLAKLFKKEHHLALMEVLGQVKSLVQYYLVGMLTELVMVSGMNAIGLYIIGVDYAILLGTISGVLNMIPYIGGVISGGLAIVVALSSGTPIDALWVFILYSFVQFVDNTFIVPLIVGSRVKLNALVSLVGVIAGGALWGVPGMVLSIPILGILKVVFDKTEHLTPWGFLMGDREVIDSKNKFALALSKFRMKKVK